MHVVCGVASTCQSGRLRWRACAQWLCCGSLWGDSNRARRAQVNVSTDPARTVDITEGDSVIVDFTYAVKWRETTVPFERRMDKYSRYSFLPQHLEACTASKRAQYFQGPVLATMLGMQMCVLPGAEGCALSVGA